MGTGLSQNSFSILQFRPLVDLLQSYPCLAEIELFYFYTAQHHVHLLLRTLRRQLLGWDQQRKYFFALIKDRPSNFQDLLIRRSHLHDMNSASSYLGYCCHGQCRRDQGLGNLVYRFATYLAALLPSEGWKSRYSLQIFAISNLG